MLFQSLMLATLTSLVTPGPTLASAALSAQTLTVSAHALSAQALSAQALATSALMPRVGAYLLAVQAPWLQLPPLPSMRSCPAQRKKRSRCLTALASPIAVALPALARRRGSPALPRPTMGGTLGGVKSFDVMDAEHVSAGPQLSWLTPESPREDLLRLRVVAPGWAVRYTWEQANVSFGVAAFTRFVMFGEDMPIVDMLTSEARIEIELP